MSAAQGGGTGPKTRDEWPALFVERGGRGKLLCVPMDVEIKKREFGRARSAKGREVEGGEGDSKMSKKKLRVAVRMNRGKWGRGKDTHPQLPQRPAH